MTERCAEKQAARKYARDNDVSYRAALVVVRRQRGCVSEGMPFARRLLIEAVEGCGVLHWARVDAWDGRHCLTITDVGGEAYRLTVDNLAPAALTHLKAGTINHPLDVDSYLADEIIQTTLFGCVIYRSEVRKRPEMAA
jgi:hypothetical protein